MPELKTLAVPLRKVDFSETSQVMRFLTRDFGKITAIARGSKRQKGSFQGPFDLFIEYEIIRLPKAAERLDVLTAASPVRHFPRLRRDLRALALASYAAELVDDLAPEAQPAVQVYDLMLGFLDDLERSRPMPLELFRFEARILKERGFFPRLLECGTCSRKITQTDAWFSPRDGGTICTRCRTRDPDAFRIPTRVLYAITNLLSNESLPEQLYLDLADEIRKLLDAHIRAVTERRLRSLRFVQEICATGSLPGEPRRTPAADPRPGNPWGNRSSPGS
jgi:DNA repair protein RecO (recombination protein O)